MKLVVVTFVHMTEKDSQGKPRKAHRSVACDDDVDGYDILTEYEDTLEFGWIPSKFEVQKEKVRIYKIPE